MPQLDPRRYLRLTKQVRAGIDDGLFYDTTTAKLVFYMNNALYAASGQLLIGNGTDTVPVTPSGDATMSAAGVITIGAAVLDGTELAKPRLRVVREQLTAASMTDGGAAIGTKTLGIGVPAGARFLFATVDTIVGFAGNVSATLTLGDGVDVDRYNTGTPSVFATAAAGADMGVPSGTAFHASAIAGVVATVTGSSDFTLVGAGGGSCYVNLWYLEPV